MRHIGLFFLVSLVTLSAWHHQPVQLEFDFPYEIQEPNRVFELPSILKEISGLTAIDSIHVAAIQDEKGIVYILSVETGKVVASTRFAGNADYEGIEKVGDDLFVLRSDGDLFKLSANFGRWTKRETSKRFRTKLSKRNDTEGLSYDSTTNRLLIICKEYPGKRLKKSRAVYDFDMASGEVGELPVMIITTDSVDAFYESERISYSRFKPSALAIHPQNGDTYLLSSPNRLLLVLNTEGELRHVEKFKKKHARQPEGIAFMPDRALIIASEAAGGRALLTVYHHQM